MEKRCAKCKKIKLTNCFSSNKIRKDGLDPYCKSCHKEYNDKRRNKKHNYILQLEEQNRIRNKEKIIEHGKKYAKSQKGKETRIRYYKNNPQKRIARGAVNIAVMYGKLPRVKTLICEICNDRQAEHYHHQRGYDKENWLNVIPVCVVCHRSKCKVD